MYVVSYCRLSNDDNRSRFTSIEAQQQLAKEYAKTRNWTIQKYYIDDDITGYIENEKRPQFYEMMKEIEAGKIDVVIAKDLSRFGRKNSANLTNIDDFKDWNVNLILTNEPMLGGVFDLQEDNDDFIGLTSWFNERYVKEVSYKVKIGMNKQQKNGTLIQGYKFGYLKTQKKGELIVDETVRETITTIYDLYEQGNGMRKICYLLNNEYNFLTPSQVIQRNLQEKGKTYKKPVKELWNIYMIKRILNDEIYTGTLITHKTERKQIHKNPKKVKNENQYRFENHHEKIISEEQFENVQKIMKLRKETTAFYQKKTREYIFGGFLRCAECGGSVTGVTRIRSKRKGYIPKAIYECVDYRKHGKSRCVSHNIREDFLLENFKQFLKVLKKKYSKELRDITIGKGDIKTKDKKKVIQIELDKAKSEYKVLINQKIKDIADTNEGMREIVVNSYKELETEKILKIQSLDKRLRDIENEKIEEKKEKIKTAIGYFDDIIESPIPSKSILNLVLKKIDIYHDKSVKFNLKMDIEHLVN